LTLLKSVHPVTVMHLGWTVVAVKFHDRLLI
jgi:hypothetical protein